MTDDQLDFRALAWDDPEEFARHLLDHARHGGVTDRLAEAAARASAAKRRLDAAHRGAEQ